MKEAEIKWHHNAYAVCPECMYEQEAKALGADLKMKCGNCHEEFKYTTDL